MLLEAALMTLMKVQIKVDEYHKQVAEVVSELLKIFGGD